MILTIAEKYNAKPIQTLQFFYNYINSPTVRTRRPILRLDSDYSATLKFYPDKPDKFVSCIILYSLAWFV